MKKFLFILFILFYSIPAYSINLISDEETQTWLYDILTPIFKSANIPLNKDYIHIVNDDSLNAFVGDKNHIFIHTGTLLKASNTNEIEGVLAHETGHILGGHILRLKIKLQDLQKASLGSLIAAATIAATSGRGDTAIAVVLGAQSSAINSLTSYQISEERSADETAINLLQKQNKSVKGLKDFMIKIQQQNRLQGITESPYFRTHPITSERISFISQKLKQEKSSQNNSELDQRLSRIQTKLYAYLSPLPDVIKRYPLNNTSLNATLAHSIYYMRQKNLNQALKYINNLISHEPKNPYFIELKAQTLFETGNTKDAIITYKQALQLKPSSDIFKISYAEAILANSPSRKQLKEIIPLLEHANRNHAYPLVYNLLGKTYSLLGEIAISDYFSAEYNNAIGHQELAFKQLNKALKQPLRQDIKLRAQDLHDKLKQNTKKDTLL